MAKKPSAGDLVEAVAFDKREAGNPDSPADYGTTVTDWVQQFAARAHFRFLRAGEAVQAATLVYTCLLITFFVWDKIIRPHTRWRKK